MNLTPENGRVGWSRNSIEASLPKPTLQDHKKSRTSQGYKGIHGKVEEEKSHGD